MEMGKVWRCAWVRFWEFLGGDLTDGKGCNGVQWEAKGEV